MRTKIVTLNGSAITIKELKIKELKTNVLPKLEPAFKALMSGEVSDVLDTFGEQLKDFFPDLKDVDLDECYPSEVEAFLEAWVDVNFTGLRRLLEQVLYFARAGLQQQGSDSENPLGSLITGKSSQSPN